MTEYLRKGLVWDTEVKRSDWRPAERATSTCLCLSTGGPHPHFFPPLQCVCVSAGCDLIPVQYSAGVTPSPSQPWCFACLGLLATLFVTAIFIIYREIRLSSQVLQQGTLLHYPCWHLPGLFCVPSASLRSPNRFTATCKESSQPHELLGSGHQDHRIARILAGSKKKICTQKPRFMSACAQLVIVFILICIQLGIIAALFIMEPPDIMHDYPSIRGLPDLQHDQPGGHTLWDTTDC